MFDLNLEKYTIQDLHELLQVKQPAEIQQIKQNCHTLKESIVNDNQLPISKQQQVSEFLNKVVDKLCHHYQTTSTTTTPTTTDPNLPQRDIWNQHPVRSLEQIPRETHLPDIPNDKVIQNYKTDYPEGKHDPIHRETIKQVVSIDSKFRKEYYQTLSTDFNVVLNSPIRNVVSMSLNALELPNSIFPISRDTHNNTLYIKDDSDSEFRLVEIPNGQYTFSAMVNVLTFAIQQLGGVYADYQVGHSDEPVNARVIIRSSTDGTGNNFELKMIDENHPDHSVVGSLGWILGFRLNHYKGNKVYAGEGLYDGGGNRYLLMRVDDFNKNANDYYISNYSNSISKDNILARIQLRVPTYTINYNTASDMIARTREYFGPVSIERLHIQLLNEYGQVVDLNHMDFSFALELTCLR